MFSKTNKSASSLPNAARTNAPAIPPLPDMPQAPAPRAAAPQSAPQRGLSTLAAELTFEGHISGNGDLQIDGQTKGDVRVGRLIIGETGAVEGNVQADYLEIRGRVVGGVHGKQVKLVATAYVDGDIVAEQLSIDVGAYFQGRVSQGQRQAPAPTAPTPVAPVQAAPAAKAGEPALEVVSMPPSA